MTTRRQWHGTKVGAGALIALASGCATLPLGDPGGAATASVTTVDVRSRRDRMTLTPADLARPTGGSTLDVLRQIRPEFFVPSARTMTTRAHIALFVDNVYDGDLTGLNMIPLEEIKEVSFFHPTEAAIRFGTLCRCDGGAILVKLRKPDRR